MPACNLSGSFTDRLATAYRVRNIHSYSKGMSRSDCHCTRAVEPAMRPSRKISRTYRVRRCVALGKCVLNYRVARVEYEQELSQEPSQPSHQPRDCRESRETAEQLEPCPPRAPADPSLPRASVGPGWWQGLGSMGHCGKYPTWSRGHRHLGVGHIATHVALAPLAELKSGG